MNITLQRTSPNYRRKLSTQRIMRDLTIGLLVIVAYSLYYQYTFQKDSSYFTKALLIYGVSIGVAIATEVVWALIKKEKVFEYLKRSFPIVTALIFALTLPIGTPLYVVAIGSFTAIFLGKLVFGGFGFNIFNPALVGRVIVTLSYGGLLKTTLPTASGIDIATKATPATMLSQNAWMVNDKFTYSIKELLLGQHAGTLGETCVLLILIVGIVLAFRRVIDARIPIAYIGTVALLSAVFAVVNGQDVGSYVLIQLSVGAVVFGAVFMATDPVTSPTSPLGKIIYGIGIGFLTMIIRLKANYSEGVLFAILMMNMFVPLIDSKVLGRTHQNVSKQWIAIALALLVSTGTVFGIGNGIKNDLIAAEETAKEEAKKAAEAEALAAKGTVLETIDGGFIIEAKGFGGQSPMKIEVLTDGETIQSVKVLEHDGETADYGEDLIEKGSGGELKESAKTFYDKVLNSSFSASELDDIDVQTGATKTSEGIINAIKTALEELEGQ